MSQPPNVPQQDLILNYAKSSTGIREIASRQRVILLCILVYLGAVVGQYLVPPEMRLVVAIVGLGVSVTASVFVFMLAIKIYGTGLGILMGILTLVPCVGLVVLLIVNGKATTLLRAAGLKVGLLGATIPPDFPQ
jgi:hypothetical protein